MLRGKAHFPSIYYATGGTVSFSRHSNWYYNWYYYYNYIDEEIKFQRG